MTDSNLSLYFKLKAGETADLEVVASAALHWVAAIKAAASELDPDARVRIEFVDAKESSLSINTILDWVESTLEQIQTGASRRPRLRKLAIALAIFLAGAVGTHYVDNFLDGPQTVSLSEEDRSLLRELLLRTQSVPEVEAESRKFFRTIERDPSIVAVGVSEDRDKPPPITIPSTEFAQRGGLWKVEEEAEERTLRPILDVTLIAAVLLSRPRSWTFQPEGLPEFRAKMKDTRFLAALDEAHVRESLRTGIKMTIRLEVKERKVGGDWVVKRGGRSVTEVISPKTY